MNINKEYEIWLSTAGAISDKDKGLERELFLAFDAAYRAGQLDCPIQPIVELEDPRDAIIARISIELERKNAMIQEFIQATHRAKESMHTALGELDKLRFGYF
jgi:hypothetical protein